MLVISRKLGDRVFIGDDICITVTDIDRGRIRLGIEAPRTTPITRDELLPADAPALRLYPRPGTPPGGRMTAPARPRAALTQGG